MAHWSELDENNIVVRVTVGDDSAPDEGYQWILDNLGGRWIKTSYNTQGGIHKLGGTPLRKNFGSVGSFYDEEKDVFIPPKPFASAILNEDTCMWDYPTPMPNDDGVYFWNELTTSWEEVTE